ncbi:VapB protein (antitoxin to VapC) [hydrothermal vent metagenome]|uniref:VapB protein (Antitoxin to VapC) n=1 Tax=hydrothermal vent metagenome TaxID=652676 RepID=A0A3B0WPK7_9ZZZZ
MQTEKHVRLFRNGRNQAVRIPREFELEGNEAIIYKEGNKLIIEPLKQQTLLQILSKMSPLKDHFPEIGNQLLPLDDINL